jgi:hypothetical protein
VFFFALGKETSLPIVFYLTLGKAFFAECRGFAECFLFGSRQSLLRREPEKKRSTKKRIPVVTDYRLPATYKYTHAPSQTSQAAC